MCHKKNHNHDKHDGVELLHEAVHILKHIEAHLDQISSCVSRWDEEEDDELFCICDEEDED